MKNLSKWFRVLVLLAFFGCGALALILDKVGQTDWSQVFLIISGGTFYLAIWWAIFIGLFKGEMYINVLVWKGPWVRVLSFILLICYVFVSMGIWEMKFGG